MGDLKVGEGFIDAVVLRRTSDNAHGTGLNPVCTVMKLSDGSIVTPTVVELTLGAYKVTDWTPAADTEYLTLWEVTAGYTIYAAYKLFKVGGGRTEDIYDIIKSSGTGDLAAILLDTGTTIPNLIAAINVLLTPEIADILADVTGIAGDAMRGTDGAALASVWTAALATALAAYTAARGANLDELDFALQEAIAAIPTTMVGTDGAALASSWTAGLATALGNYTAGRAAYLDQLDFNLQEAIAAIPTTMVGTDNAALAASWTSTLATALGAYTAVRGAYLDQLDFNLQEAIAAIPTTMVGTDNAALASAWTAALATALENYTAGRAVYLDQLDFNLQEAIAAIPTTMVGTDNAALASVLEDAMQKATDPAYNQDTDSLEALREAIDGISGGGLSPTGAGVQQTKAFPITAALNAGITTVATVTTQPVVIDSIVLHADTAAHADMTTCAIEGGVGQVVEFIGTGLAIEDNLNAADKQVWWIGAVRLAVGKIIYIDLQGVGATAADLTVTITYHAEVSGGILA